MSFLAPLALLGLLGLAGPIVAHLLGREQPRPIAFAAVRFLSPTWQVVTQRRRVHSRALLVVRAALLALLVLALARPVFRGATSFAVIAEPHDAVVVLDVSRSMDLRVDGMRIIEHAIDRIEVLLAGLPAGSRVGFLCTDPDVPRLSLEAGSERIVSVIRQLTDSDRLLRPGSWPLALGLDPAIALLRESSVHDHRKRVVYAVGDATLGGLGSLPGSLDPDIILVPVPAWGQLDLPAQVPEHVSVDSLVVGPAPDIDPTATRIRAIVRRHGDSDPELTQRPVAVLLHVNDREVARAAVSLPFETDVPVEFTHMLLGGTEPQAATVSLAPDIDDPLASDDARHAWLSAAVGLEVLVVNGDPSQLRAHDEVFFLTTALNSTESGRNMHVGTLAPDQLEQRVREHGGRALTNVDVLVLANVRAPEPDIARTIVTAVHRGMGLWISAGDRVDASAYNEHMNDVLPLRLRESVVVGTAPGRTEARVETMAPADLTHPALRGLTGDLALSSSRARRIFLLEPDATRDARVALAFGSGAPALVTRQVELGRVALLTTSIDRDWADLPLRPGFVALAERTIAYLGGGSSSTSGSRILAGEPKAFRTAQAMTIVQPSGQRVSIAPDADGVAQFRDTWTVGHYRVAEADDEARERGFVVEVDPAESDTRFVAPALAQRDDDQSPVVPLVPSWRPIVLLAAILLALEAGLRWRLRR